MEASAVVEPQPGAQQGGQPGGERSGAPRAVLLACLVVLCLPLVVALVGFRRHAWTPVLDLAMTELRVRDVGGRHSPLIGLPGRIGTLRQQGSHPGPVSFYALAPTYLALGSTAWALQVATALVHAVAMGTSLVIASRRGGTRLVVAVALLLAVLTTGYGGGALTEPWNPYLPLLWWVVLLLAVWSVLCGDLPMLPVVVVTGSFCGQTHIPYLGLALGMGALAAIGAALHWRAAPLDRARVVRWSVVGLGLGVLLWLPPVVDQVRHDPGNLQQLVDHFSDPPEQPQGLAEGARVGLEHLDLARLAWGDAADPGWLVTNAGGCHPASSRGAVLVAIWLMSAAIAVRRGRAALVRLHVVVGTGLVLMILAISRIFGAVWFYLTLWGWAIGLVALMAVAWTIADEVGRQWSPERRHVAGRVAIASLVALVLVLSGRFTIDAWNSPHADAPVAAQLARVVDDTAAALDAGAGGATGHDGRYLVTWDDALHIGSQGFGLVNELERRGFDVGVDASKAVPATTHRVLPGDVATRRIVLATGLYVDRWRERRAVEVAFYDPRGARERQEQARLRSEVIESLRRAGLNALIPQVDRNLFGVAIDVRLPEATKRKLGRILELGGPLAVFVAPVTTTEP